MPTVRLTENADVFSGTDEMEDIYGLGGDDIIYAKDGNDSIHGGDGDDTLNGGAGDDFIYGGDGHDSLNGSDGADYMAGNTGDDLYRIDHANDIADESGGGSGIDTVWASISVSFADQPWMFGGDFENLSLLGTSNINGTGNAFDNLISSNAGSNILDGRGGADTMIGRAGSDSYYVDNVGDKAFEANVAGEDKVYSTISYSISGQFIENLTLTGTANINGTGNSLSNAVAGNAGRNTLYGLQGNDTLNGLAGQDVIYGGIGNDTLIGGTGHDRFVFDTAPNATTNRDTITDFNVVDDNVWLDNAVFTAFGADGLLSAAAFHIGTGAHDANDRIIYNSTTGALFYDSNGSAAGGSVQFATLSKGLAMTNADFLIV